MLDVILQFTSGIPAELAVFILAMTPIVELRAALPVALAVYQFSIWKAFLIVIIGNMIPAFFILFGWDWFVNLVAKQWPWLHRLIEKWNQKTQVQWDKKIERYGPLALILFVAIPLPGSGVWSGSLAAWIFRINKRNSILSILAGVVISAVVVALITMGGVSLL